MYIKLGVSVQTRFIPAHVAQSVTCLTANACLTADPGVASSIPAQSYTFMEIDHEIISTVILFPSADSRTVVVIYKRNYVHEILVNCPPPNTHTPGYAVLHAWHTVLLKSIYLQRSPIVL